ncbi:hypothetical protein INT45_003860 [Circinella minor]|uniref:Caffeoyl-CoA O-methyltransferase n=1 Tax=Circinella minor TaxID=1195481 RepID=A0A8H7SEI8_9FUNG|nr:hypothetical protein INT45_003860 [Circinella minor]
MNKLLRNSKLLSPRRSLFPFPFIVTRCHSTDLLENSISNKDNRLRLYEEKYSADMSTPFSPSVKAAMDDLAKQTREQFGNAHMMIPETQGKMLHQLVQLFSVSRILEIGTFTGFSTLAMASALNDKNNKLISLERDPKPQALAKEYIKRLGFEDRVDLRLGSAMESLSTLVEEMPQKQYDLIFIDADKKGYVPYYDFVMDNKLLSDRGIIIADNVLFFGQVHRIAGYEEKSIDEVSKNIRKKAKYAHEFNQHVLNDTRVQVMVLPLFDGVSIITKKRV